MDTKETTQESPKESVQTPEEGQTVPSRKKKILNVKENIKKLPDKKPHLDFIAALLTIPVLITVLILNLANLKPKSTQTTPTPTPGQTTRTIYITQPGGGNITPVHTTNPPQPTSNPNSCIKEIGPISISSPQEGDTVTSNPACITISYNTGNYCSVVWAYKINNGPLSDYSNDSVCLYNLPNGTNTFELNVKSLASNSTQTLVRHFTYKGPATTPTPSNSPSATPTVSPTASP